MITSHEEAVIHSRSHQDKASHIAVLPCGQVILATSAVSLFSAIDGREYYIVKGELPAKKEILKTKE